MRPDPLWLAGAAGAIALGVWFASLATPPGWFLALGCWLAAGAIIAAEVDR